MDDFSDNNIIGRDVRIIEVTPHKAVCIDLDTFEIVTFKSHVDIGIVDFMLKVRKSLSAWVRPSYPNEVKGIEDMG